MQLPAILTRAIGWTAYELARLQPFLPTYTHLLASALFPIYAGSHSSLSRPSSAAPKSKRKTKKSQDDEEEDDDDEVGDEPSKMEGLSPTDALMFPILAGATLTGLYFLIKWLNDPILLNKILNWYFASFSVFSVSRMVSDGLDVLHSLLFPHDYLYQGKLYHVNWRKRQANSTTGDVRSTPLPGFLSRLPLPQVLTNFLWTLHVLPIRKLGFKAFIHRILDARISLGIHGIEGLAIGLASVLWFNFISKPWWLTNLMGFGFAYGTLQLMSPTTFWTGTMILSGLFFYDIYFVFFTPMMVTVAKSLDIPIKLIFPRPPSPDDPSVVQMSMLGLGDVVLPGIMIGLALRFDLYMHYLRKQTKRTLSDPKSAINVAEEDDVDQEKSSSPSEDEMDKTQALRAHEDEIVKAPYQPVGEGWGDRFWTSSLFSGRSSAHNYVSRNAFPKPYFHAGLIGYTTGMIVTLGVMQVFEHAQPALLYLVPGVLASLWGRAWTRGELKQMWEFSETFDEEEEKVKGGKDEKKTRVGKKETETPKKQTSKSRNSIFSQESAEARAARFTKAIIGTGHSEDEAKDVVKDDLAKRSEDRRLIAFSVELPPPLRTSRTQKDSPKSEDDPASRYNLRSNDTKSPERAEKRQRIA